MYIRKLAPGTGLAAAATVLIQVVGGPAIAQEPMISLPTYAPSESVELRATADRSIHSLLGLLAVASRVRTDGVLELAASPSTLKIQASRLPLAKAIDRLDEETIMATNIASRADRSRAQARWNVGNTGALRAILQPSLAELVSSARSLKSAITGVRNTTKTVRSAARIAKAATARQAHLRSVAKVSGGTYTKRVWASGFQTQLNACRGAVNLTAAYGVPTIGEKWGCGGSRFPRQGAIVRLTGVMRGLYRVGPVVATLNAYTDSTRDIPRGQGLLYQTCAGGSARTETFTQLTRIG